MISFERFNQCCILWSQISAKVLSSVSPKSITSNKKLKMINC